MAKKKVQAVSFDDLKKLVVTIDITSNRSYTLVVIKKVTTKKSIL